VKFLGIDLGWSSGASGLCCLTWSDGSLHLLDLSLKQPITDIHKWVDNWTSSTEPALIAVDDPTLIPNATGCAYRISSPTSTFTSITPDATPPTSDAPLLYLDLAPNPQNRILGLLHSKSAYRACAARSAPRGLQNY
jgi:predicted RNase H-like nuclease